MAWFLLLFFKKGKFHMEVLYREEEVLFSVTALRDPPSFSLYDSCCTGTSWLP